jgi:hypothetical protein
VAGAGDTVGTETEVFAGETSLPSRVESLDLLTQRLHDRLRRWEAAPDDLAGSVHEAVNYIELALDPDPFRRPKSPMTFARGLAGALGLA